MNQHIPTKLKSIIYSNREYDKKFKLVQPRGGQRNQPIPGDHCGYFLLCIIQAELGMKKMVRNEILKKYCLKQFS